MRVLILLLLILIPYCHIKLIYLIVLTAVRRPRVSESFDIFRLFVTYLIVTMNWAPYLTVELMMSVAVIYCRQIRKALEKLAEIKALRDGSKLVL